MIDVLFILPDDNGNENPFGKIFNLPCDEDAPVENLFAVIRRRLGAVNFRLSLEVPSGDTAALGRLDPQDPTTVGSRVASGARIIVGWSSGQCYDPALSSILTDLTRIRHWCSKHPTQEMPPAAVKYLCENQATILFLIEQLKSGEVRRTLYLQNRELDESVIDDDCAVAISVAKKACMVETGLVEVTDDDVNMMLRPIEYVKYLNCDSCSPPILSPILLPN